MNVMLVWFAEIGIHVNFTDFEKKMMVCRNGIDGTEKKSFINLKE